ncbi:hypothetical protein THRCLA_21831 [Thraustotheca clavata]|uniref:Uncharacterized protein n=1 Tax=Thraustotheca clavata TaxID=74557 RepID=A0A1V9ZNC2_9STRA|nr:hypothetical protein THRCLA_21831 [Thraustotheca clavata]
MPSKGSECQYSYKPCTNPRSTKRNGSLHLLCEFHRKKANAIQREYARKKRLRKLAITKLDTNLENAIEKLTSEFTMKEDPTPEFPLWDFLDQFLFET